MAGVVASKSPLPVFPTPPPLDISIFFPVPIFNKPLFNNNEGVPAELIVVVGVLVSVTILLPPPPVLAILNVFILTGKAVPVT